jgi:prepilin-type processing-associated H-X9-DG protein
MNNGVTSNPPGNISAPSEVLLLWEDVGPQFNSDWQIATNDHYRVFGHNDGADYSFVDGHAKYCAKLSMPQGDTRFTVH